MNFLAKTFITAICSILLCVSAQKLDAEEVPNPEEGICNSIDVRNSPVALESIRNCTIIVGYLQIVLMEGVPEKFFDKYSFPKLREVTNFVLLYRVEGLQSVGQLFPNLTLIRGRELFNNYALIIYELPQLLEVRFLNFSFAKDLYRKIIVLRLDLLSLLEKRFIKLDTYQGIGTYLRTRVFSST